MPDEVSQSPTEFISSNENESTKSNKNKLYIAIIIGLSLIIISGVAGYLLKDRSISEVFTQKNTGAEYTTNSLVTFALEEAMLTPLTQFNLQGKNQLVLLIAFKNKNEQSVSYRLTWFRLKDSMDREYEVEFQGDRLGARPLNPGETTKVGIYFTVPEDETEFKLNYSNITIDFFIPYK